jgi:hypothetical protein
VETNFLVEANFDGYSNIFLWTDKKKNPKEEESDDDKNK